MARGPESEPAQETPAEKLARLKEEYEKFTSDQGNYEIGGQGAGREIGMRKEIEKLEKELEAENAKSGGI